MIGKWLKSWTKDVEPSKCIYDLPRGFHSSIDNLPAYLVLYGGQDATYILSCSCGNFYQLHPNEDGIAEHEHNCRGLYWIATLRLEDFATVFKKKK